MGSLQILCQSTTIARMMKDGKSVRELVEHYSGTIQLSPLELVVTATQCLIARPYNTYSPGDASYALMGLMRRRPRVNPRDSAFKAFARLSLLNDNDRILERLICLQPDPSLCQPWHSLRDIYFASLWDIEPCTQVAGIIDAQPVADPIRHRQSKVAGTLDETQIIVLDGAFGAAIKWERLDPVAFLKVPTAWELFGRYFVRGYTTWLFVGLLNTILGGLYCDGSFDCKDTSGHRNSFPCSHRAYLPLPTRDRSPLVCRQALVNTSCFVRSDRHPRLSRSRTLHFRLQAGSLEMEHPHQHSLHSICR